MCNKNENICPLLKNSETYNPDTVEISKNSDEWDYWLPTLENLARRTAAKAESLHPNYEKAAEKAEVYLEKFLKLTGDLKKDSRYVIFL